MPTKIWSSRDKSDVCTCWEIRGDLCQLSVTEGRINGWEFLFKQGQFLWSFLLQFFDYYRRLSWIAPQWDNHPVTKNMTGTHGVWSCGSVAFRMDWWNCWIPTRQPHRPLHHRHLWLVRQGSFPVWQELLPQERPASCYFLWFAPATLHRNQC